MKLCRRGNARGRREDREDETAFPRRPACTGCHPGPAAVPGDAAPTAPPPAVPERLCRIGTNGAAAPVPIGRSRVIDGGSHILRQLAPGERSTPVQSSVEGRAGPLRPQGLAAPVTGTDRKRAAYRNRYTSFVSKVVSALVRLPETVVAGRGQGVRYITDLSTSTGEGTAAPPHHIVFSGRAGRICRFIP